jgi:TPR repeat protein
MRLKLIILLTSVLLTVGCTDNKLNTTKGTQAYEVGDYALAFQELVPFAKRGNRVAEFYMGKMFYLGHGVEKDLVVAFDYYKKSADKGFSKAQNNLGLMYINGESVAKNPELGYEWVAKSADQGFVTAQVNLGIALTYDGSLIPLDRVRGLRYFEAAAAQDDPNAITKLGGYYTDIEKNHKRAGELFENAAGMGDAEAMHRLHFGYMSGFNRNVNKKEGFSLLQRAALKNYVWAYYDLAQAYMWGNGTDQNIEEGYLWLTKSATQANDHRAMESIAQMTLNSRDAYLERVENLGSISSGLDWRKKAALGGNNGAQLNLYSDLYFGKYQAINKTEAMTWLKAAAQGGSLDANWDLGQQYLNGWDIPVNYDQGIANVTTAAKGGLYKAMGALGVFNYNGDYVTKDYAAALSWFEKIPVEYWAKSLPYVPMILGLIYSEGGPGVKRDRALAENWFNKSDSIDASMMLSTLYFNTQYGPRDLDKTIDYATASEGSLDGEKRIFAQTILFLAFSEKGNLAGSLYWAEQAFQLGSSIALDSIAVQLLDGTDFDRDIAKGISLLSRSARSGSLASQLVLAELYLKGSDELGYGLVVPVDLSQASAWLKMAANNLDDDSDFRGFFLALNTDLKESEYEAERQRKIQRLELAARLEKIEREKLALQRQVAEYKRQQKKQTKRREGPTLGEVLIGGIFKALGEGIAMGVNAKINQELGVKKYDANAMRKKDLDEVARRARYEAKKAIRMEKIQKNLRTQPSIGYQN